MKERAIINNNRKFVFIFQVPEVAASVVPRAPYRAQTGEIQTQVPSNIINNFRPSPILHPRFLTEPVHVRMLRGSQEAWVMEEATCLNFTLRHSFCAARYNRCQ